jgi:lipopolysaccharide transport system ATP-binding protein
MSYHAIQVEGISKRYVLGSEQRSSSFREAVSKALTDPFRRFREMRDGGGDKEFWALRDVSFNVKAGEAVGIIGRNGAGKSTLLKILSRITPPTQGRIRLKGRVASLLEVGTGFHQELTGRENIFLNGAMLGMTRAEIQRKFDEIVAFSEVEQFLDTPVKRYSSGMYVRLAFGVAAHLEPEILIVDEVLAVGDAQFQKKCLGKMKEVSTGSGRTVLFVSHNMAAVQSLCSSAVVMRNGGVDFCGEVGTAIRHYSDLAAQGADRMAPQQTGPFECLSATVRGPEDREPVPLQPATVRIRFKTQQACFAAAVHCYIEDVFGTLIMGIDTIDIDTSRRTHDGETIDCVISIGSLPLIPGAYNLRICLKDQGRLLFCDCKLPYPFEVAESPIYGVRQINRQYHGMTCANIDVSFRTIADASALPSFPAA